MSKDVSHIKPFWVVEMVFLQRAKDGFFVRIPPGLVRLKGWRASDAKAGKRGTDLVWIEVAGNLALKEIKEQQ